MVWREPAVPVRMSHRSSRLLISGLATALVVAGFLAGGLPVVAGPNDSPPTQVVDTSGEEPVVSGDGRRVAYVAASAVMRTDDDRRIPSVWLLDRATGERRELTTPIDGVRAGASVHPVLSGDGCTVVVVTQMAFDLFRDNDHGERWDIYRTILPGCAGAFEPGEWELVSSTDGTDPLATDLVDRSSRPTVNASGEIVAYTTRLAAGDGVVAAWMVLALVDLTIPMGQPGRVSVVPGLPSGGPTWAGTFVGQRDPVLSSDGRYLAYVSDALPTVVTDESGSEVVTTAWTDRVIDGQRGHPDRAVGSTAQ